MPLNRDQVQTTRWFQLCFVPTSLDDSDDSDIESVVLTTSTPWQELSPPSSPLPPPPPNPEPQIDWRFPPPPPPPDFVPPPNFLPHSPPLQPITRFNRQQPPSSSHVIEGDQSECIVDVMNGISRVRISEIDENSHCPICMEEFKVDDQACQLPCNHNYCSECILRWLDYSKTCPVCRLWLNGRGSDRTNGNNSLVSQLEILPPPVADNVWEYFFAPFEGTLVTENSAGGDEDEADYDSACDELGDSPEDGASESAPAPLP